MFESVPASVNKPKTNSHKIKFKALLAASITALSVSLSNTASAQRLFIPEQECTTSQDETVVDCNGTIDRSITVQGDDVIVNVGSMGAANVISGAGNTISIRGQNPTLNILNPATQITGTSRTFGTATINVTALGGNTNITNEGQLLNERRAAIEVFHFGDDINITSTGPISSNGNQGIDILNAGTGDTNIAVTDVTVPDGLALSAIDISQRNSTGDISITSTGTISTGDSGMAFRSANTIQILYSGTGDITLNVVDVINEQGRAINIDLDDGANNTGDISVTSTGTISTNFAKAIEIIGPTSGDIDVSVVDVRGGILIAANPNSGGSPISGGGNITVTSTGAITAPRDRNSDGIQIRNNNINGDTTVNAVDLTASLTGLTVQVMLMLQQPAR